jgi:hypothetical protein
MKTDILALYSMFLPSMIRLYDITFWVRVMVFNADLIQHYVIKFVSDLIQHYVIKFVSDLRLVGDFLLILYQ